MANGQVELLQKRVGKTEPPRSLITSGYSRMVLEAWALVELLRLFQGQEVQMVMLEELVLEPVERAPVLELEEQYHQRVVRVVKEKWNGQDLDFP